MLTNYLAWQSAVYKHKLQVAQAL